MNREQKEAAVAALATELGEAEAIFAVDYRGISVPQAAELRTELRNSDTAFRVVKNRLTLLAADKAGTAEIKDWLEGPTALALVKGDAAAAAKTLTKLGAEFEVLDYKGGIMDGAVLDPDEFKAIAKLPGRDQLNAQLAGMVASPLVGLVRGLGSMISGLALQLGQIAEQGLVTGEPPKAEAEAPKEEAPAAEEAPEAESGDSASPAEEASPGGSAGEAEQPPENDGEAVDSDSESDAEEAPKEDSPEEPSDDAPAATPEPETDTPASTGPKPEAEEVAENDGEAVEDNSGDDADQTSETDETKEDN
jgi:large subunit ribosomal protein L10